MEETSETADLYLLTKETASLLDPELCKPVEVRKYKSLDPDQAKHFRSIKEGEKMDAENEIAYEFNRDIVQALNPLLRALNMPSMRAPCPDQQYGELARRNHIAWCMRGDVRICEAIKYMNDRELLRWPDFLSDLENLPEMADEIAFRELCDERKRRIGSGGFAVRGAAGLARWDGVSPTDSIGRYVKWERMPSHSFLTPRACVAFVTHPLSFDEED